MNNLLVFGLGFSAEAFLRRAGARFDAIAGTVRTAAKATAIAGQDRTVSPLVFDGEAPSVDVAERLATATHLLISIPPGEAGDPVLRHHGADIARAAPHLAWIGYLSTVGVYGDRDGGWVDEETPPAPASRRSIARLAAEAAWTALGGETGVPVGIFRLAGIYGPGRNALCQLADGTARRIVKPGQVFNRIHVDDIAAVLDAARVRPAARIYNVADDEPGPPQDVVAFAAALSGHAPLPDIPFEEAGLSPMGRSFYSENKRVSNRRIHEELGVSLAYPTYREGLTALWQTGRWRGGQPPP